MAASAFSSRGSFCNHSFDSFLSRKLMAGQFDPDLIDGSRVEAPRLSDSEARARIAAAQRAAARSR